MVGVRGGRGLWWGQRGRHRRGQGVEGGGVVGVKGRGGGGQRVRMVGSRGRGGGQW